MARRNHGTPTSIDAEDYRHKGQTRKNIPPAKMASEGEVPRVPKARYAYNPHLSPALRFDSTGQADELDDLLAKAQREPLTAAEAQRLADALRHHQPWLEWTTKQEEHDRGYFDVDPVALHIHERVSAKAIIRAAMREDVQRDLFADPKQPYREAVRFYKHDVDWANRLILGDSLQVISSLAKREGLAGKVQMVYIDPPYGIRYKSNFQPLVRSRAVGEREQDLTREPEVVRAYRDTWTLGVHTYLSYLHQRLTACRDLLALTGSIFVQIGEEHVHRVRSVLDDVFGSECHVVTILIKKKGSQKSNKISPVNDYLLWYCRTPSGGGPGPAYNALYEPRELDADTLGEFTRVELPDGRTFPIRKVPRPNGKLFDYRIRPQQLFKDYKGARLFRPWPISNGGSRANQMDPVVVDGREFHPPKGNCWRHTSRSLDGRPTGMQRLLWAGRLLASENSLDYKRYLDDFPFKIRSNWWDGLGGAANPVYVVQTNEEIVKRCILMTTSPGDLVLDPTCGSATTAVVAEQWGRRWITIDTSRVSIALARARILTTTFPPYEVAAADDGTAAQDPGRGFVYKRAHRLTSSIFANCDDISGPMAPGDADELARSAAPTIDLIDQPEVVANVLRVSGPFTVEGVRPEELSMGEDGLFDPTPNDFDDEPNGPDDSQGNLSAYLGQMVSLLTTDGVTFTGNQHRRFTRVTPLYDAGSASPLHAEGLWAEEDEEQPDNVAIAFGPQYGPVTALQVEELIRASRRYDELVVAGFSFTAEATATIQESTNPRLRIHQAYIRPDVNPGMDGLLKETPGSQLFTVFGLPEISVRKGKDGWVVELAGVDIYDPVKNTVRSTGAKKVAAWFLDQDFDGRCFCISQAFFPDQKSWDKIAKALKGQADPQAFARFKGTVSNPFDAGEHKRIAVKVIDPRGNEVMAIHRLEG